MLRHALIASMAIVQLSAQQDPAPARLLKDINTGRTADSAPTDFLQYGPWCYFAADDGLTGRELYRTLGAPGTTEQVADLEPGAMGSHPRHLMRVGGQLAFFARVGGRVEFHVSDGTAAGTRPIALLAPATEPVTAVRVATRMVARVQDSAGRNEIVLSDGTPAGSVRLATAIAALAGRNVEFLSTTQPAPGGGEVAYFTVAGSTTEDELWRTDGTVPGTRSITTIGVVGLLTTVEAATVANPSRLLLTLAPAPTLLAVDVTTGAKTVIRPTISTTPPGATFDGRALFSTGTLDAIAIATDGATWDLVRLAAGAGERAAFLEESNGAFWLVTDSGILARLTPGSNIAVDAANAPFPERPEIPPIRIGDMFFYEALRGGLVGVDTARGSARVLFPGRIPTLGPLNGLLLFQGSESAVGSELYRYDPIRDTVSLVDDINRMTPRANSRPLAFTRFGERIVFHAESPSIGREPWISDGTTAGTVSLGDLTPGSTGTTSLFLAAGEELWIAPTGVQNAVVHRSDGTPTGTVPIATLTSGTRDPAVTAAAALAGNLLFAGTVRGTEGVWHIDRAGAVQLLAAAPLRRAVIVVAGSRAFLAGTEPDGKLSVWATDGTPAGTYELGGPAALGGATLALFDGRLWVTSGDAVRVSDSAFTRTSPMVTVQGARLVAADDRLFAIASQSLLVTTGATRGFQSLPVGGPLSPFTARAMGSRLLFQNASRPWITDGTAAGTLQLSDVFLFAGQFLYQPTADGRAFFGGFGSAPPGPRLWITDGTRPGTRLLEDVMLVSTGEGTEFRTMGLAGGRLYFIADSPLAGVEPFVADLVTGAEQVGSTCTEDPGRELGLRIDAPPVLGTAPNITGIATGATSATLLFGLPARVPVLLPGTAACTIEVEPTSMAFVGPFAMTDGRFRLPLGIPNLPALRGVALTMQPLFGPGSQQGSVDIGTGLRLQLGD